MTKNQIFQLSLSLCSLLTCAISPTLADQNGYFGANTGVNANDNVQPGDINPNAGLPGLGSLVTPSSKPPAGSGDYTDDEKRMQRKYKGRVTNAKSLIAKGEQMMKDAGNNPDNKDYKKGKILKEIGEKDLAELEANNPFGGEPKKDKAQDKEKAPDSK